MNETTKRGLRHLAKDAVIPENQNLLEFYSFGKVLVSSAPGTVPKKHSAVLAVGCLPLKWS